MAKFSSGGDVFPFGRYMLNTFVISFVTGICSTFLASLAAYAIARLRFPAQSLMANGVLFVYMVGGVLLMVPLYQMSVNVGLASSAGGTIFSLFLIYLIQTLPVAMYMLGNYFRTIPFSLEEAAMMDGCSRVEAFWRIIMPLSKPMLFTVFIYCFVIVWNEPFYDRFHYQDLNPDLYGFYTEHKKKSLEQFKISTATKFLEEMKISWCNVGQSFYDNYKMTPFFHTVPNYVWQKCIEKWSPRDFSVFTSDMYVRYEINNIKDFLNTELESLTSFHKMILDEIATTPIGRRKGAMEKVKRALAEAIEKLTP